MADCLWSTGTIDQLMGKVSNIETVVLAIQNDVNDIKSSLGTGFQYSAKQMIQSLAEYCTQEFQVIEDNQIDIEEKVDLARGAQNDDIIPGINTTLQGILSLQQTLQTVNTTVNNINSNTDEEITNIINALSEISTDIDSLVVEIGHEDSTTIRQRVIDAYNKTVQILGRIGYQAGTDIFSQIALALTNINGNYNYMTGTLNTGIADALTRIGTDANSVVYKLTQNYNAINGQSNQNEVKIDEVKSVVDAINLKIGEKGTQNDIFDTLNFIMNEIGVDETGEAWDSIYSLCLWILTRINQLDGKDQETTLLEQINENQTEVDELKETVLAIYEDTDNIDSLLKYGTIQASIIEMWWKAIGMFEITTKPDPIDFNETLNTYVEYYVLKLREILPTALIKVDEQGNPEFNRILKMKSWEQTDYYLTEVMDELLASYPNFNYQKP